MEIKKFGIGKDDDIRILEKTIGMELPEDYKNFLRQNNGGRPNCYSSQASLNEKS